MAVDWEQIARDVGSIQADGSVRGGTRYAQLALELVIGEESVRAAVDLAIDGGPGAELACNVLRHLYSRRAAELAYEIYRSETGERAADAVLLISRISNPIAVGWIQVFLADDNVALWGAKALDQLVWDQHVDLEDVEHLLVLCENHDIENIRETAAFIRSYLAARKTAFLSEEGPER